MVRYWLTALSTGIDQDVSANELGQINLGLRARFPNGFTAYGPEECSILAAHFKDRAEMNADSYAWFATAVYFDDWDFSTGRAVAIQ